MNKKPAIPGGFPFDVERFSDARRSAVNRSPASEQFVISGFPIDQLSEDADTRFDSEAERGLIFKPDFDLELSRGIGKFHEFDGLAFDWKSEETPVGNCFPSGWAGSLRNSHDARSMCFVVRGAFRQQPKRVPFCFIQQPPERSKEEMAKPRGNFSGPASVSQVC